MTPLQLRLHLPPHQPTSYPITVGGGLLKKIPEVLKTLRLASRYVIITDNTVKKLYGDDILRILRSNGLTADMLSFPAGERSKNLKTYERLTRALLRLQCGRDTMILALGGGVTGDLAGFTASTYMRGIPYVQIPTTLLAMVDSSIGGKTGVDSPEGKNLIGAFWHPEAVIADTDCLKTLPREQLVNGLMEAVKIFLTHDAESFRLVEQNVEKLIRSDSALLQKVIGRAVELKMGIVSRDEHESGERMTLNFGHTIGHALEHLSGFNLLHGHAVALGILAESKISEEMGILPREDFDRIQRLFRTIGIDESPLQKYKVQKIIESMRTDKKNRSGKVRMVALEKIGKVKCPDGAFAYEIDDQTIQKALQFFSKFIANPKMP